MRAFSEPEAGSYLGVRKAESGIELSKGKKSDRSQDFAKEPIQSVFGARRGPISYELREGQLIANASKRGAGTSESASGQLPRNDWSWGRRAAQKKCRRTVLAGHGALHLEQDTSVLGRLLKDEYYPHNMALQLTVWGQLDRYALSA
jgi:hypothetical protein